jgi:hypothetical protein
MPLQQHSTRRRLDPHLYDWPADDSAHEYADLPLLDWRSGPASEVQKEVVEQFESVATHTQSRLRVRPRHEVVSIEPSLTGFKLEVERDSETAREKADGRRVRIRDEAAAVFLAVGFGLEPRNPAAGVPTESYWSDAGLPAHDLAGKAHPRYFISGNGDGALIDLVAAATTNFDHAEMIRKIIHQPNISSTFETLREIDDEARAADAAGSRFDFIREYDSRLLARTRELGLIDQVRHGLRPGVQLTLQTQHQEAMSVKTATLNRVAAYLVMKACEDDEQAAFHHVHCADTRTIPAPTGRDNEAPYWFECGDEPIPADRALFRRGPDRASVRSWFSNVIGDYEAAHKRWLASHGPSAWRPMLSEPARRMFERLARDTGVSLPRHRQEALAAQEPLRAQIQAVAGGQIRWTGDINPAQVVDGWRGARALTIYCAADPETLGSLAFAVARLAIHGDWTTLSADVANWRPFLEKLSAASRHAEDLIVPPIRPRGDEGAIRNPSLFNPDQLARTIHAALDGHLLTEIDRHISGFIADGTDPSYRVGFKVAPDLRERMRPLWRDWHRQLAADQDLLGRFLRLTICAFDDATTAAEAAVLVGPRKLKSLIRATAVAAIIAVGWRAMAPNPAAPGNLMRRPENAEAETGHACAAERIDGETMAVRALKFMWGTNFVILPMMESPMELSLRSGNSLASTETGQPRLDEIDGASNIIIAADSAFRSAVGQGVEALNALLDAAKRQRYDVLSSSIERQPA